MSHFSLGGNILICPGHVFVTSVLLGGQQKTSKYAAALEKDSVELREDALRDAFGTKINAQYIAASVQSSKERGTSLSETESRHLGLSQLGMCSTGGDTLGGSE